MESLKRKPGAVQARITKNWNEVAALNVKQTNVKVFDEYLEITTKIAEDFEDIKVKINAEIDKIELAGKKTAEEIVEMFDEQTGHFDEIEKSLIMLRSDLKAKIAGKQKFVTVGGGENGGQATVQHVISRNHFPELQLKKFDGESKNWIPFKERFEKLFGEDEHLSIIQKFDYLLGSLTDSVKKTIENLDFCAANYEVAMERLHNKYFNKKIIIDKHISGIVNMKAMSKESAAEIQRIIDEVSSHLDALKNLDVKVDEWDPIVIYLVAIKLESETRKRWEEKVDKDKLPTWSDMLKCLQKRLRALESVENAVDMKKSIPSQKQIKLPVKSFFTGNDTNCCVVCEDQHEIGDCKKFVEMSVHKRWELIKSKNLCFNCFGSHQSRHCKKSLVCTACPKNTKSKHHFLLHITKDVPKQEPEKNALSVNIPSGPERQVLISTALVYLYDKNDKPHLARAVIDSASEANFITESFADRLGVHKYKINQPVKGIEGASVKSSFKIQAYMRSRNQDYGKKLDFLLLKSVTKNLPSKTFSVKNWNIPSTVRLADPNFEIPGHMDILIGAELFMELLLGGKFKLGDNLPWLQETWLGWLVNGVLVNSKVSETDIHCHVAATDENLSYQLEKFWAVEVGDDLSKQSSEQEICEKHFCSTFSRDDNGRYIVELPLNEKLKDLGDTREIAVKRLHQLSARLVKNPKMKQLYSDFINEYLMMGHMRKVEDHDVKPPIVSYMPHHGVYKPNNPTTKLRVVFNASQPSSTGVSLNDVLMNGGIVQRSLNSIIMRQRLFKFAITSDITKMYRQISVKHQFWPLQRIVWKENVGDPIQELECTTLTYGTKIAPFAATRTLNQIAIDGKEQFPMAAERILNDVYVDDVITGANSIKEAVELQNELIDLLQGAGMKLHKWCANDEKLVQNIPKADQESFSFDDDKNDGVVKTLGMLWKPKEDIYKFKVPSKIQESRNITKRAILSEISRLFDPLGLVSPIIVKAKIFMQKLWIDKVSWDDKLNEEFKNEWQKFSEKLGEVATIEIPRWINPLMATNFELIGFSDASKDAFGVCVYLKCVDDNKNAITNLIFSRSRVASLTPESIPRLELRAAVLLAETVAYVKESLDLDLKKMTYFCDSKVVLAWIKTDSIKLQAFVGNRVARIQKLTNVADWNYVTTKMNPADIVSRGMFADKLKNNSLWWHGPESDLLNCENQDAKDEIDDESYIKELRKKIDASQSSVCLVATEELKRFDMLQKFQKIRKLQIVVAYIMRFYSNCRKPVQDRSFGRLSTIELNCAMEVLVKIVQLDMFGKEIDILQKKEELPMKHPMKSLNLILSNGVLRVGGRISNSRFNLDKRHQMLLPKGHQLTEMLVKDLHIRFLHVGQQGLLAILREKFWIVNGKNEIKRILKPCLKCFRVNPKDVETFMGDLPNYRVETTFPFFHTGVDYGGPILIKLGGVRSRQTQKAWVALFICMATKAIHLELVTDLTSATFIACLHRFISRRGRPQKMYSDNGTNFIGAKSDLQELKVLFNRQNLGKIGDFCAGEGIEWNTIPPQASHFGGEWEAGIKSMKFHYKRIAGNANLTYEETLTLLVQIESILNSRPINAMSNDPNDFNPLTPAHFLIGRSLTSFPEPDLSEVKTYRLSRWERIVQIRQHFWKRFSQEYVTSLQQRSKWFKTKPNIVPGMLVLLKEGNQPSLKWKLGRITDVHPGKDGIVRVVTIKTANSTFKRDTQKICILPTEDEVFK